MADPELYPACFCGGFCPGTQEQLSSSLSTGFFPTLLITFSWFQVTVTDWITFLPRYPFAPSSSSAQGFSLW